MDLVSDNWGLSGSKGRMWDLHASAGACSGPQQSVLTLSVYPPSTLILGAKSPLLNGKEYTTVEGLFWSQCACVRRERGGREDIWGEEETQEGEAVGIFSSLWPSLELVFASKFISLTDSLIKGQLYLFPVHAEMLGIFFLPIFFSLLDSNPLPSLSHSWDEASG